MAGEYVHECVLEGWWVQNNGNDHLRNFATLVNFSPKSYAASHFCANIFVSIGKLTLYAVLLTRSSGGALLCQPTPLLRVTHGATVSPC